MVAGTTRSASHTGLVHRSAYDGVFTEKEKRPAGFRIRRPGPGQTQPGNWKENKIIDSVGNPVNGPPTPPSPLVNRLDEKTIAAFPTNRPLDDRLDTVQCRHCRRPVLRASAKEHIKECLEKKQAKLKKKKEAKEAKDAANRREKGLDDDDEEEEEDTNNNNNNEDYGRLKKARKGSKAASAAVGGDGESVRRSKKRKADGDAGKAPSSKKKKRDEPKAKPAKVKGPVDVEKQCGVLLPNGSMCARSLTCKSHSMGAKRAVPGRSLPYDMLLAQYQKKNQAKQQRAAIDANAPPADDTDNHAPVDSDDEKDAVMAAIARSRPAPLVTHPLVSMRSRYRNIRFKDMLHKAMAASHGPGLFFTSPDPSQSPAAAGQATGFLGGLFGPALARFSASSAPLGDGACVGSGGGAAALTAKMQTSNVGHAPRPLLPGHLPGPPSSNQSVAVGVGVGAGV